ncbi:MAG: hypothetical protein WCO25_06400 [Candidatus Uhrbacteria bacterium]
MSFGPVTRFGDHSSEGDTDDLWCVGGHTHLRAMEHHGREAALMALGDESLSDEDLARRHSEIEKAFASKQPAVRAPIVDATRWSVSRIGPCNGTCKPASTPFDLAERVAEMRKEAMYDSKPVIRRGKVVGFKRPPIGSTVDLDAGAQAIVDAAVPIAGRKTHRWYAKRDSEGEVWCLGDRHVRVATEFSWWSGRGPSGVYKAHKITVTPCDGSRAPRPVELTDQMARAIDAALARQVA